MVTSPVFLFFISGIILKKTEDHAFKCFTAFSYKPAAFGGSLHQGYMISSVGLVASWGSCHSLLKYSQKENFQNMLEQENFNSSPVNHKRILIKLKMSLYCTYNNRISVKQTSQS